MNAIADHTHIQRATMPSTSATQRDAERKAKAESAWRTAVAQACIEQAGSPVGAEAAYRQTLLTELAITCWHRLSSDDEKRVERLLAWEHIPSEYTQRGSDARKDARIRGLTDGQLCQYFTAVAVAGQMHQGMYGANSPDKPTRLLALAEQLGVDAAAIREQLRREQLQRTPGPAKGKPAPSKPATPVTPETALGQAVKRAQASKPRPHAPVRYRDQLTGQTWSGRGLQPAWLKVALANGRTLADFLVADASPAPKRAPAATLSPAAADPFRDSDQARAADDVDADETTATEEAAHG